MDVHLRDLRYFVAVAEELHFTRAAARLFISQPALSRQIAGLERQLHVSLLVRDRRSVALTDAGAALLDQARHVLGSWDAAQLAVSEAAAASEAVLVVGFSTRVGREVLPGVTARFTRRRPTWRVQLRQVDWSDPTAGVGDGTSDIAYVWLPLPEPDLFSTSVVATEARHVALPAGHRLAATDVIPFDELLDEPFLALPSSAGPLRDHWLATAERDGRPVRIAGEVTTADETFEAVASGLGIALLSAGNAELYRRDDVVTRAVVGIAPSELALVWRRDDVRPALRDFIELHDDPPGHRPP